MALTKPTLFSMAAFDATEPMIFTFNVLGGSQVVRNQLYIYQEETLVYSGFQTTYAFVHTLPANTLTNGEEYTAYVVTYDAQGSASAASNSISFNCFTQPTFRLSTITPNSSTLTFTINYDQDEQESLSSYEFNLYDGNFRLINSSGIIPTGNPIITEEISYSHTFNGFINNVNYYIEVIGQTEGGTQLSTGKIYFLVRYEKPSLYQQLGLTNNCNRGSVTITSQVSAIIGTTNPDPPTYVDNNTAIDLTEDGAFVKWNDGVSATGDWTMGVWGKNFRYNEPIVILQNVMGQNITISLENDGAYVYAILYIVNSRNLELGQRYVIISESIALPNDTDELNIWVRNIGNIYDIKLVNLG